MNPRAASERMDFMTMDFRLANSAVKSRGEFIMVGFDFGLV